MWHRIDLKHSTVQYNQYFLLSNELKCFCVSNSPLSLTNGRAQNFIAHRKKKIALNINCLVSKMNGCPPVFYDQMQCKKQFHLSFHEKCWLFCKALHSLQLSSTFLLRQGRGKNCPFIESPIKFSANLSFGKFAIKFIKLFG